MTSHRATWMFAAVLLMSLIISTQGHAYEINFEDLAATCDPIAVTDQYNSYGLTFTNASLLTAGFCLNELEFPPHSGQNVIFDDGGPIIINFVNPVLSVEAFFTYMVPLSVTAYDSSNNIIASDLSSFSNNLLLSGDAGSTPNELLQVAYAGGISWLEISGDALFGGSFVMDDLTVQPIAIPEPSMLLLLGSGLMALTGLGRFRK